MKITRGCSNPRGADDAAGSNTETIHIAYSHLLDTIGMPELEYQAFLKYKQMKDKYDFMQSFTVDSKFEIAKTLAAFGAFTEGLCSPHSPSC
jgi:ribonucleoside-diphosphate reductase beta chain